MNERNILKIVEWAHRHKIQIEDLSLNEISEALRAYLRDPSHS